jgi:cytochrome c biogenesis protein ResB
MMLWRRIIGFLQSVRLALVLIAWIALYGAVAASISGGMIDIGITLESREAFRSPLFLLPLSLFALNLLLCTLRRIAGHPSRAGKPKIGPDLVHISLLLLIIAGTISLFGRWEGQVLLSPGEMVRLEEERLILLEEFRISRYDNGMPKGWTSLVTLLDEKGNALSRKEISVNRPARIGAYRIYQATWHQEDERVYSGLMAVRDPSSVPVIIALTLMIIGLGLIYIPFMVKLVERR